MRLSRANLDSLPDDVAQPGTVDGAPQGRIVHFGLGAFARAHLAWYTQAANSAATERWRITGVSLRSPDVAQRLMPQDGLFTLTERSGEEAYTQVVDTIDRVLVAREQGGRIVQALSDPACSITSFTVTEKGYCRGDDGSLDTQAAAEGFYPMVEAALSRRRAQGGTGITFLSCDNLPANGAVLRALLLEWLNSRDPGLAEWTAGHCTFPCTMVDRIVPAPTDADCAALADRIGMTDEGAVFTERFSQWVIEDDFAGPRPSWELAGAQLVGDAAPYETAKLRMLNGAHSALAYAGLAAGHRFVHEAVADPACRNLAERLMRDEAAPSVQPAPGQDLARYADRLMTRFADPALAHRLEQIAMDGSEKIPQRWLETAARRKRAGEPSPAILRSIAAWLRHLEDGSRVNDPRGPALRDLVSMREKAEAARAVFGPGGPLASNWEPEEDDLRAIAQHWEELS